MNWWGRLERSQTVLNHYCVACLLRAFERPVFMRACCPTTQNQGYVRFKMLPIQLTAWYLFPCRHLFFFTYWHEHKLQMKLMRSVHLILLFNLFFSLVASQHSLSSNRFLSLLNNYPVYYIAEQKCKRRKRVKKSKYTYAHTPNPNLIQCTNKMSKSSQFQAKFFAFNLLLFVIVLSLLGSKDWRAIHGGHNCFVYVFNWKVKLNAHRSFLTSSYDQFMCVNGERMIVIEIL